MSKNYIIYFKTRPWEEHAGKNLAFSSSYLIINEGNVSRIVPWHQITEVRGVSKELQSNDDRQQEEEGSLPEPPAA